MGTPYLGEIRVVSFNFAPKGWALCNGQLLPINQNQAIFSLLGTTYGGNGQTNFALPNLQARIPMHNGAGFTQGQVGGESAHTLTLSELPSHTHLVTASSSTANQSTPGGYTPAATSKAAYGTQLDTPMLAGAVSQVGGSQPHDNMSPYLTLNFVIALQGIFPSRN